MAAIGVAIGIMLAVERIHPAWGQLALAPLAAAFVTAAGNAFNDAFDLEVDRKAHPSRPLPSGVLSREVALAWSGLLACAGLVCAFMAGGWMLLSFASAVGVLLLAYEFLLKHYGLPGNVVVAALVAATFPFGALAAGASVTHRATLLLAAMAFLANLAREIAKDAQDLEADRGVRRTFPMQVGTRGAGAVALVLALSAVSVSIPLAFALDLQLWDGRTGSEGLPRGPGEEDIPMETVAFVYLFLFVSDAIITVGGAFSAWSPRRAQKALKHGMLLALAAMVLHGAERAACVALDRFC